MKKSKFNENKILAMLKEAEAERSGVCVSLKKRTISSSGCMLIYLWKTMFLRSL